MPSLYETYQSRKTGSGTVSTPKTASKGSLYDSYQKRKLELVNFVPPQPKLVAQQPQPVQPTTVQKAKTTAQSVVSQAKPVASGAISALKGFIQQVPSYARAAAKNPKATAAGAGAEVVAFGSAIPAAIQRGIASVTKKEIPERWDLTKQEKAFKELVKLNLGAEDNNAQEKAFETGVFLEQALEIYITSQMASLTVGKHITAPVAAKYVPKMTKIVPAINNAVAFTGLGQIKHDPEEGTRVNRLKNDLVTFAVFEGAGFLAKGIGSKTRKLMSKSLDDAKIKLKSGKPVAITEMESSINVAKEAVLKETNKQPQQILIDNVMKSSDDELVKIVTPKVTPKKPAQSPLGDIKPKTKPKTVTVPREQLPVGGGKQKLSKLEARVTESLKSAPDEVKGLSTYNQMSKRDQIQKAARFVTESPDDALAVLRGDKPEPKGVLRNSIYVAMENQAKGDVELARKLASLSSTRAGQEISILSEIDRNSPVKAIREVINIREQRFLEKFKGRTVQEAKTNVIKDIKKRVKPVNKYDWNNFINSIDTC